MSQQAIPPQLVNQPQNQAQNVPPPQQLNQPQNQAQNIPPSSPSSRKFEAGRVLFQRIQQNRIQEYARFRRLTFEAMLV